VRKPLLLGVDDELDVTLTVERYVLVLVLRRATESERPKKCSELLGLVFVGGELNELHSLHADAVRHPWQFEGDLRFGAPHLVHEIDQRAAPIDGD
jgi:hypothetical protein